MSDEHVVLMTFIIVFGLSVPLNERLNRLGKQLEAVCTLIRSDLARTQEQREEMLQQLKEDRQQAAKDARHFQTWFWGVGLAVIFGWSVYTHYFR